MELEELLCDLNSSKRYEEQKLNTSINLLEQSVNHSACNADYYKMYENLQRKYAILQNKYDIVEEQNIQLLIIQAKQLEQQEVEGPSAKLNLISDNNFLRNTIAEQQLQIINLSEKLAKLEQEFKSSRRVVFVNEIRPQKQETLDVEEKQQLQYDSKASQEYLKDFIDQTPE